MRDEFKQYIISLYQDTVTIESLQFFFMRGFSEVDDVLHNTVGYLIGFGITILRLFYKTR